VVAKRTGLSPCLIRIWERRYAAVEPARTSTNRRRYSEAEVERLTLLRQATRLGHSIGAVAGLRNERLRELVAGTAGRAEPERRSPPTAGTTEQVYVAEGMAAIRRLDAPALEGVLQRACIELGCQGLLQKVVGPLAQELGEKWECGEITAAEEHFASAVVRLWLGSLIRPFAVPQTAPLLVVATPAGQLHELGAVIVAAAAVGHGWRVAYLGASLPAAEIAGAVAHSGARAVALSLVYPQDDPDLPRELEQLRQFLRPGTRIVAGGRAAEAYCGALARIGAETVSDLRGFHAWLDACRAGGAPGPKTTRRAPGPGIQAPRPA
jgi:DNA-binding transcriptional MerR regulator/methylmalonyl-CoA mutase cobalamin-binding subunit